MSSRAKRAKVCCSCSSNFQLLELPGQQTSQNHRNCRAWGQRVAITECHLCGAWCFLLLLFFLFLSSSSSSSHCGRDLCKAPRARLGLFLSLAALPLTFLAVPPASALLANPFYRELNIAQAARKICSAGHVGLGSASAASAGAGGVQGLGGGSAYPVFSSPVPINGEHRGTACFDGCRGVSHLSLSQHHHFCPARCLLGYTHQHWGILGWGVAGVCHQPCSCQQNHSTKPQIAAVLRKKTRVAPGMHVGAVQNARCRQ